MKYHTTNPESIQKLEALEQRLTTKQQKTLLKALNYQYDCNWYSVEDCKVQISRWLAGEELDRDDTYTLYGFLAPFLCWSRPPHIAEALEPEESKPEDFPSYLDALGDKLKNNPKLLRVSKRRKDEGEGEED